MDPISQVGLVVGTVPYMAPEQLRGAPVDARTDLFSLGILLYELSTGKRPFQGASSVEISSAILRDAPPPPTSLRADLPRDLARVLERCLEKDPERRIQTAKDVRNELELLRRAVDPQAPPQRPKKPEPVRTHADSPSVAVLPFANRSASADDEYFSDGLADELISVLVKIKGLKVAARTSSASFKGKDATIEDVGRALNVQTVVEGSVRKAGNRVRISVQLIKVDGGDALWSETYDRALDDIFAVQDDIAQSVVKELRTTLLGGAPDSEASGEAKAEVAAAAQGRGTNPEAHRLLLEGRHFLDRLSGDGIARGIELLERATSLDPGNALAWAELGRAYWSQGAWGFSGNDEGVAKGRAAIQRALDLAPGLPEALVLRAWIEGLYEFDLVGAEASLRQAYDRAPSNPAAIEALGMFLSRTGRNEEGERLILQAVELDPLSARTLGSLASLYRVTGRFEESIATMRKAIALSPDRVASHHMLGLALALSGRPDEALEETMRERAEWARLTGLASIFWKVGRHAESDAALAELIAKHAQDSAFQIAAVYVWREDKDAAFEWLDRAIQNRDAGAVAAPTEVAFRILHSDARWKGLLERLGFAHLPLFKEQTG